MADSQKKLPRPLRFLHWFLIANAAANILYAGYQVFVVLRPDGVGVGPLGGAASQIPHELLVARRLYGIECWVTIAGLMVYLALTEFLPRMLRPSGGPAAPERTGAG